MRTVEIDLPVKARSGLIHKAFSLLEELTILTVVLLGAMLITGFFIHQHGRITRSDTQCCVAK